MLNKVGVEQIISAVENEEKKNVKISPSDICDNLWGYNSNDTYDNDDIIALEFKITDGKIEYTNGKDRGDIEKTMSQLLEKLKTILKEQLGDKYNEELVEKVFEQAQISAVYNLIGTTSDDSKFKVSEFVDQVVNKFNKFMTAALHEKNNYNSVEANYGDTSLTNGLFEDDLYIWNMKYGFDANGDIYLKNDKYNSTFQIVMDRLYDRLVEKYKAELGDNFNESMFEAYFDLAVNSGMAGINVPYLSGVPLSGIVESILKELDCLFLR